MSVSILDYSDVAMSEICAETYGASERDKISSGVRVSMKTAAAVMSRPSGRSSEYLAITLRSAWYSAKVRGAGFKKAACLRIL